MLRVSLRLSSRHAAVLGVSEFCTPDELKAAYHKLVKTHHPDVGGDVKRFQEIQASYTAMLGGSGAHETQASHGAAAKDAHWEFWAQYHPSRDPREAQRSHTESQKELHQFQWHLYKLVLKWTLAVGFVVYVVVHCASELENPSPITQGPDDPYTFTLRKTRQYEPSGSQNPEYIKWRSDLDKQVERESAPMRKQVAAVRDKNTTYAVSYRGQPFSAATPNAPGVRNRNRKPEAEQVVGGEDEHASDE